MIIHSLNDWKLNLENQNEFNEFELYLVETPKAKGGKSTNNNCLYHCLKDVFFDNVAWADGLQLKKYLKLKN